MLVVCKTLNRMCYELKHGLEAKILIYIYSFILNPAAVCFKGHLPQTPNNQRLEF